MRFYNRLTITTILLIIATLLFSGFLFRRWQSHEAQIAIEGNLMNVALTLSENENLQVYVKNKRAQKIQPYVEELLRELDDVDIITVADMDSVRLGHPNRSRLGETFVGGDEKAVVENAESYTSIATGTLGESVRAFRPIFYKEEQVGFLMVGYMYKEVLKQQRQDSIMVISFILYGIVIGSFGAFVISRFINKSLLNLEPEEIVRLYRNQEAILATAREGIIAIDDDARITLMNQSAKDMLGSGHVNVIDKPIAEVFPETGLIEVLESGKAQIGKEQAMAGTHILANRIPIYEGEKIVGAMATFLDRTEFIQLAEEVTGVRIVVRALRANVHEFRNKMHVLLGLLQLEEYDIARKYIRDIESDNENLRSMMSDRISNQTIHALLVGKYNRAQEEGIRLYLTEDSTLDTCSGIRDDDLIVVIGNLLENAIEAISRAGIKNGEVQIFLKNYEDELICQVVDNGPGIDKESLEMVTQRGFTTKENSNGIGMDLVKKTIERYWGQLSIESEIAKGTEVTAVLKRGGRNVDSNDC